MPADSLWILSVLDDLLAHAARHCRPEISFHLQGARRDLEPCLSDLMSAELPDPETRVLLDVLDEVIAQAERRGMTEARLHLLAARRRLLGREPEYISRGNIITLPLERTGTTERPGS